MSGHVVSDNITASLRLSLQCEEIDTGKWPTSLYVMISLSFHRQKDKNMQVSIPGNPDPPFLPSPALKISSATVGSRSCHSRETGNPAPLAHSSRNHQ